MNRLPKIMSAVLSVCMLVAAFPLAVGAAVETDCSHPEIVINGSFVDCRSLPDAVHRICTDGSCNFESIMQMLKNDDKCTGQGCTSQMPEVTHVPQPVETQKPDQVNAPEPDLPSVPTDNNNEFRTAFEDEVIRLVNMERAKYGLSSLQKDTGAMTVAHIRAKEIVQVFSHTRPNGTSCFTAAADSGVSYSSAGENIAYGYADPEKVVEGWMNSDGHRKNILSSSFDKIGVGCYESGNTLYWSQFFIG